MHTCLIPLHYTILPITNCNSFRVSTKWEAYVNFLIMNFPMHDGKESPSDEKQHNIVQRDYEKKNKQTNEQYCVMRYTLHLAKILNLYFAIGSLHDPVTWYKITHAGEQVAQWDFQNNGRSRWTGTSCIVLEVPLRNLLTCMCDFVPCDRIVQRGYWSKLADLLCVTGNYSTYYTFN